MLLPRALISIIAVFCVLSSTWAQDEPYDGVGNAYQNYGAINKPFCRVQMASAYGDGKQLPWGTVNASGSIMPSPRQISNVMGRAAPFRYNIEGASELTAAWAQFLYDDMVRHHLTNLTLIETSGYLVCL